MLAEFKVSFDEEDRSLRSGHFIHFSVQNGSGCPNAVSI